MPRALIIEFGLFGVGRDKGPPPILRLGVLALVCQRGGFIDQMSRQERALQHCRRLLLLIVDRIRTGRGPSIDGKPSSVMVVDEQFLEELDSAFREIAPEPFVDGGVER